MFFKKHLDQCLAQSKLYVNISYYYTNLQNRKVLGKIENVLNSLFERLTDLSLFPWRILNPFSILTSSASFCHLLFYG